MSVSDGDALRRAILDQPDDYTLRLIYADWLDENGQPDRAAFVRAQVWAAQAEPYIPDARKHADTADRVRKPHKDAWVRHLGQRFVEVRFERGVTRRHPSVSRRQTLRCYTSGFRAVRMPSPSSSGPRGVTCLPGP